MALFPPKKRSETFTPMPRKGRFELELAHLAGSKLKLDPDAGAKAPVVGVKQEVIFTINKLDVVGVFFV